MPVVDLYDEDAPPAGIFLMAHLSPLGAVGQTRIETDPLPFREVNILDVIPDDDELYTETALASVHTYYYARTPEERVQARRFAAETDRRIMLLAKTLADVAMPDATTANCDWLKIVHKSMLKPYGANTIHRYTGRFRYSLAYVAVS